MTSLPAATNSALAHTHTLGEKKMRILPADDVVDGGMENERMVSRKDPWMAVLTASLEYSSNGASY